MTNPTQIRVRELLEYDEKEGVFKWRVNRCNLKAGTVAGCMTKAGYSYIRIDKVLHTAHRLAWLYIHGELPAGQIDHINGDRSDNRIANLRTCTNSQNQQNRKQAQASSLIGVMGVSRHSDKKRPKPYQAHIKVNRVSKSLGYFATAEEAGAAYLNAKRNLHEFNTL